MKRELIDFLDKRLLLIISLLLFFLLLPLSKKVDFMQNDDWYYYQQVEEFSQGNFTLHKDIAPTFYLLGIIGLIYSIFFSLETIPILTLLVSVLNFYIFAQLLKKHFVESKLKSILISLLMFLNPLHGYSIWGFMTENYFLFLTLLGIYLFYESVENRRKLISSNIVFVLSLLIRQLGFVYFIASSIYFALQKEWEKAISQIIWFIGLYISYELFFPKTFEMQKKALHYQNLLNFKYTYSLFFTILIYLVISFMPIVIIYLLSWFKKKWYLRSIILAVAFTLTIMLLNRKYFRPQLIHLIEYPYFENTYERTGYYPRDINGTKYHFKGMYDYYNFSELIGKVFAVILLVTLLVKNKHVLKRKALFLLSIYITYFGVMVTTGAFYDRYLIPIVPVFNLLILSSIKDLEKITNNIGLQILTLIYVIMLAFIFYTYSFDFILTESYVWNKSLEISENNHNYQDILATSAWNEKYIRHRVTKYVFSYDSQDINEDFRENFTLIDSYTPIYPLNIHVNPKVFLYERIQK